MCSKKEIKAGKVVRLQFHLPLTAIISTGASSAATCAPASFNNGHFYSGFLCNGCCYSGYFFNGYLRSGYFLAKHIVYSIKKALLHYYLCTRRKKIKAGKIV
jgi:hypothetical protein